MTLGRDPYVTNSGQATYTFASLPTGAAASAYATTLYACVRDVYGASNCTTTSATVRATSQIPGVSMRWRRYCDAGAAVRALHDFYMEGHSSLRAHEQTSMKLNLLDS